MPQLIVMAACMGHSPGSPACSQALLAACTLTWRHLPRSCPGEQLVDVAFRMTPAQPSLHILWSDLTGYAFAAFAFSFLFISLALGIFKCGPRAPAGAQPRLAVGCPCMRAGYLNGGVCALGHLQAVASYTCQSSAVS